MNMQNLILLITVWLLLLNSGCCEHKTEDRWQIKTENPAYGLTLGYSLPSDQLQEIIGSEFKPLTDENGNGFLMLFFASAKQYYLNNLAYNNLQIAHILVVSEGSLNSPLTIGVENQELNAIFEKYNFQINIGSVDLSVEENFDSIYIEANIHSMDGNIELSSSFPNNPGALEYLESTKVSSSANPNSYFIGDETYRPIIIDSLEIKCEGTTWISQLNLPLKPDTIWLNTDFTLDFTFTEKEN